MKESSFIIGRQPLLEAIESGKNIEKIYLQNNSTGETIQMIRELAAKHHIPIRQVPLEKLQSLTRGNHQGCVAVAAIVSYIELQKMIEISFSQTGAPLFLMLDGITDVRNIGAIARSALCYGAQGIIIPDKGVGALNEEAMKTSAGALNRLLVSRVNSLAHAVDTLHLTGVRVLATQMKATKKVSEIDLRTPSCVILGSEDRGVQNFLLKAADELFSIPMAGGFDSLNVSVAAGIILYEAIRQRMQTH